jgi:hypothetical protein
MNFTSVTVKYVRREYTKAEMCEFFGAPKDATAFEIFCNPGEYIVAWQETEKPA